MYTLLETLTIESLSFSEHLRPDSDHVEGLSEGVGDEGQGIDSDESILVHSLVSVSPVFDFLLSWHDIIIV